MVSGRARSENHCLCGGELAFFGQTLPISPLDPSGWMLSCVSLMADSEVAGRLGLRFARFLHQNDMGPSNHHTPSSGNGVLLR